jgi:hypothetical protein
VVLSQHHLRPAQAAGSVLAFRDGSDGWRMVGGRQAATAGDDRVAATSTSPVTPAAGGSPSGGLAGIQVVVEEAGDGGQPALAAVGAQPPHHGADVVQPGAAVQPRARRAGRWTIGQVEAEEFPRSLSLSCFVDQVVPKLATAATRAAAAPSPTGSHHQQTRARDRGDRRPRGWKG